MPTSPKSVTGLLLFAKNETTPNAGASISSTDVIQTVLEHPVFSIGYTYDGNRNGASYSGGSYGYARPKGRTTEGTIRVEGKGRGSNYSAGVTPPNLHAFLNASGLSGSFEATSWVYKPVPLGTVPQTVAIAAYTRGEVWPVSGALCNLTINGDNPGPTIFEFGLQGSVGIPADIGSLPTRTWQASGTLPPNNTGINLTIGSYTGSVVRSWRYEHNLEFGSRLDVNVLSGHSGFAMGRRNPQLVVTIETPPTTEYDAYNSQAGASGSALSLTVGTEATNRYTVELPNAFISNITPSNDGPVATLEITYMGSVSAPDANDDVRITFNG